MPFLDWSVLNEHEELVRLEVKTLSAEKSQLKVIIQKEKAQSLISQLIFQLEETFLHQAGELRWSLSGQWVLFWKLREEGNRALLAHPKAQEWVGTIALELECAKQVLQRLAELKLGSSLSLNEVSCFGSLSNLELILSIESPKES